MVSCKIFWSNNNLQWNVEQTVKPKWSGTLKVKTNKKSITFIGFGSINSWANLWTARGQVALNITIWRTAWEIASLCITQKTEGLRSRMQQKKDNRTMQHATKSRLHYIASSIRFLICSKHTVGKEKTVTLGLVSLTIQKESQSEFLLQFISYSDLSFIVAYFIMT